MLGQTLKQLRIKRGLSQGALADRTGYSKSLISSIERNLGASPSMEFIEKVSYVLGIVPDVLLDEYAKETYDPVWTNVVSVALETGYSAEQYLELLKASRVAEEKIG